MGGPVIDLEFSTTAPDTQLHARLWDVAPDGSAQGLITRGTYRSVDTPGGGRHARFQLTPQGYRFPAGHRLKVEVTANDVPYFQQSNIPAVVQVAAMRITLPLYEPPGTQEAAPAPSSPPSADPPGRLPATGRDASPLASCAIALVSLAGLLALRRLGEISSGVVLPTLWRCGHRPCRSECCRRTLVSGAGEGGDDR